MATRLTLKSNESVIIMLEDRTQITIDGDGNVCIIHLPPLEDAEQD